MNGDRAKLVLSISILLVGSVLVTLVNTGYSEPSYQSDGITIDFGNYEVIWTDVDYEEHPNAMDALAYACVFQNFTLTMDDDGYVSEIDGRISDPFTSWRLWVVERGDTEWNLAERPSDVRLSDYAASSWAYRTGDDEPTVAVDRTGKSIYGYGQSYRTVSLSPSLTEMVASVGATKTLVGTDRYSNYPDEIVSMKNNNDISIVGDFTTPVFERIVKVNPDIVLCDGSQYNHLQVADKLRKGNVNAVVLFDGDSLDTIVKNMYIIGTALGYDIGAKEKIDDMLNTAAEIQEILATSPLSRTRDSMIALSPDMSPFVAGDHTYAGDIITRVMGDNVFIEFDGWVHVNSEMIMKNNPEKIIIIAYDYRATEEEYNTMFASLSNEWKMTDAYKDGQIYLICEGAGEASQRPGPRAIQLMELVARILQEDVFTDIQMKKYIGDDYREYITYSKYIE